jgi:hypothetical protein
MSEPEKQFVLPKKPGRKRRTQADLMSWINSCLRRATDPTERHISRLSAKGQATAMMWALGYSVDEAHAYIEQLEAEEGAKEQK